MNRKIIHLDLDAFFCAVEEKDDPALIGKPFAVGGKPEARGVVSSCSYAARQYGVRSAMPMLRALRIYPDLKIIPPHYSRYRELSKQVIAHLYKRTHQVEQVSIDEAFLDVTEIQGSAYSIAYAIQMDIHKEPGLPCSLGVASNKLVAKIANDYGKTKVRGGGPPNAITVVEPGKEAKFLAPLAVQALWGVGPKTAGRLAEMGVTKIGELAQITETDLVRIFGKIGYDLARHSRGIDDHAIATHHEVKSISQETTFDRDIADAGTLRSILFELSEGVGSRLRSQNLMASTIRIKVRWPNFETLTRQRKLDESINNDQDIYHVALELFENVWQPGKHVRLIGVGVSGFGQSIRQLSFWNQSKEKEQLLQNAIDEIRTRFGKETIRRGRPEEHKHGY